MSTQYLVQPFVWRNWPVDEVLAGWLELALNRLLVAATIAVALAAVTRIQVRALWARAGLIAAAVLAGAIAGEALLILLDARDVRVDAWSIAGRVVQWSGLSLCVAAMYALWMRDRGARAAMQAANLERGTADAARVQTELQFLRQQIDPHFLFNTLATVRRFGETDVAGGARLLRELHDYLRSTMPGRGGATLGEELELAATYLSIVATRMSGRLSVSFDVPQSLRGRPFPSLALATLAENAVKHGITPKAASGTISIHAREDGDALVVVVADTGAGLSASPGGRGIGLANVHARLQALHGHGASLLIENNEPAGVRATLRIPTATVAR